jgi:hypothetical protein
MSSLSGLSVNELLAAFSGLRGYYKGTSLIAPIEPGTEKKFLAQITQMGQRQIVNFIRAEGLSLNQIGDVLKAQLDVLEDGLCRESHRFPPGMSDTWTQNLWAEAAAAGLREHDGTKMSGKAATAMWFINIASLLKLKRIKDDAMNGWVLAEAYLPKPICVLCKKHCENEYGNNPDPVATDGVCCDSCNLTKVIPARLAQRQQAKEDDYPMPPLCEASCGQTCHH